VTNLPNTPGWQDEWAFKLTNTFDHEIEVIIEPEGDVLKLPSGHSFEMRFSPAFKPEVEVEPDVVTVYGGPWYRVVDGETELRNTLGRELG
jgi:hypothetical protein